MTPAGLDLQPGDVLFYKPAGLFGKLITLKTWSDYSHVELWLGHTSPDPARPIWGSRNPESWLNLRAPSGVNFYPFRSSELALVRRPVAPVNVPVLVDFATKTAGQKYDWFGLLKFFRIAKGKQDRMFCSEAVARALRIATGSVLFSDLDADAVSPGMLGWTPELKTTWKA